MLEKVNCRRRPKKRAPTAKSRPLRCPHVIPTLKLLRYQLPLGVSAFASDSSWAQRLCGW